MQGIADAWWGEMVSNMENLQEKKKKIMKLKGAQTTQHWKPKTKQRKMNKRTNAPIRKVNSEEKIPRDKKVELVEVRYNQTYSRTDLTTLTQLYNNNISSTLHSPDKEKTSMKLDNACTFTNNGNCHIVIFGITLTGSEGISRLP
jgi:hypothetical protein